MAQLPDPRIPKRSEDIDCPTLGNRDTDVEPDDPACPPESISFLQSPIKLLKRLLKRRRILRLLLVRLRAIPPIHPIL